MNEKNTNKQIAFNRRALHDYHVLEKFECGVVLQGTEVKSVRAGNTSLAEAYAQVNHGEVFVYGWQIAPYEQGNRFNSDPLRPKKLLLHKREINKLLGSIKQDGLTLIPLNLYFHNNRVKLELALCRGKKNYDKREALKERMANKEIVSNLHKRNKYGDNY